MPDWVFAVERAYVAAAVGGGPRSSPGSAAGAAAQSPAATGGAPGGSAESFAAVRGTPPGSAPLAEGAERLAHAIAAAGAVASRFLAVGTPRSFGIVIDTAGDAAAAALSLAAHRTWFAPRDIRCAATASGAEALAAATGGRAVSVDEALACDIVALHATGLRVTPSQLRRGTHVNAVTAAALDPELLSLATVVREAELPALAAGLVDGRQLDELTIFCIDGAAIAAAVIAAATATG